MKHFLSFIASLMVIIAVGVASWTYWQATQEQQQLQNDLTARTKLLARAVREAVEVNVANNFIATVDRSVKRLAERERVGGIVVFDSHAAVIAVSDPKHSTTELAALVGRALDIDQEQSRTFSVEGRDFYALALPLHDEQRVSGAVAILQQADYIKQEPWNIWRENFLRLFLKVLASVLALLLFIRWFLYRPISRLTTQLKSARLESGDAAPLRLPRIPFFRPLIREIMHIRSHLADARGRAEIEARLRMEKIDSPWTGDRLSEMAKEVLKDRMLVVVSNREPYIHTKSGGQLQYYFPASGMATAIEPLMRSCGGLWVAHGSGDADRQTVDAKDHVAVPPDDPRYTLRRIWLNPQDEQGYYFGFSNEGVWPLCHNAHVRPIFRKEDWEAYQRVNQQFANAVLQEIKDVQHPLIFVQDYLLALVPRMIKKQRRDAVVALFWHIPWPNSEAFSICPYRSEILDGMLGADLLGFHTQLHCNNFIDTVGRTMEALIDWEQFEVQRSHHTTMVKSFPISIAFPNGDANMIADPTTPRSSTDVREAFDIHTPHIVLGVDRIDYIKGLVEKLRAIELFFEKYPAYKEQVTFVQIAPSSREKIESYRQLDEQITSEVERINAQLRSARWKPIVFLKHRHTHEQLNQLYKAADVCLITSLHDGMNLVAKEYVAAHDDERGVLVVSQFAGVSRELKEAMVVNPYDVEQVADVIKWSLECPKAEEMRRMKKMREVLKQHNVYQWAAEILRTMVGLG
ncbi:trehalose-6-phosphate synthase [Candidatus Uhrbacteria bacterium]|nr:trehalose-6-phosphate synthase [Candidatus Uhrbacteria bacterium]